MHHHCVCQEPECHHIKSWGFTSGENLKICPNSGAGPARLISQSCSVGRVLGSYRHSQSNPGVVHTVPWALFVCGAPRAPHAPLQEDARDAWTEVWSFAVSWCCRHKCRWFKERAVGESPVSCHKVSFLCLPTTGLNFSPAAFFPVLVTGDGCRKVCWVPLVLTSCVGMQQPKPREVP